jgi:membrane protein
VSRRRGQRGRKGEGGPKDRLSALGRGLRVLAEALRRFRDDDCFHLSAGISFFTLVSFIPLSVLLILALTLVVRSSENLTDLLFEGLRSYLPVIPSIFVEQVGDVVRHAKALVGIAGVFLFVTADLVFSALQNSLNQVFRSEKRPFIRSRMVSLGLIIGTGLLLAITVMTATLSAAAARLLGELGPLDVFAVILRNFLLTYVVPLVLMTFVFVATIKGIPNTHVRLQPALIAGLFGAVLWEVAKDLFTWYVGTVPHYHLIYGSLGTVILVLIWVDYSASLLLLSAELAAVLNEEGAAAGGRASKGGGERAKRGGPH